MQLRGSLWFVTAAALWTSAGSCDAAEALQILGGDVRLDGAAAARRIVVQRLVDGKAHGQATGALELQIADPAVAKLEAGVLRPVGDGATTLTARLGALQTSVRVTATNAAQPTAWSFRNHVQSVMVKGGCSSGACHGALAGKNGFRLSLRGYDAEGDFLVLTHQARGRRVDPADPGRSLILTKPTAALPHGGGKRFEVDSLEYRVLADWIADGCPAPTAGDPRIESLEILPPVSIQQPGATQQQIGRAHV